jgi:hypothetical protein
MIKISIPRLARYIELLHYYKVCLDINWSTKEINCCSLEDVMLYYKDVKKLDIPHESMIHLNIMYENWKRFQEGSLPVTDMVELVENMSNIYAGVMVGASYYIVDLAQISEKLKMKVNLTKFAFYDKNQNT